MKLYLYREEESDKERRQRWLKEATTDYCQRKKCSFTQREIDQWQVSRGPHGKPYFTVWPSGDPLADVHFSISHTKGYWACLFAEEMVGFDLEVHRERSRFLAVSARFFTAEEHEYVKRKGLEGFFQVWVRKEAYLKYTGGGIAQGLSSFSVVKEGELCPEIAPVIRIEQEGAQQSSASAVVEALLLKGDLYAAYCIKSQRKIDDVMILA